jgi:hypothetical protein
MSFNSLRAAACALLLVSGAASAEVRTFYVTGTVIESEDASTPVGTTVHASFSYDDGTQNTSDTNLFAFYDLDAYWMTGSYGAHQVDGDLFHATVWNNFDGSDSIDLYTYPPMLDGELMLDGTLGIHLYSPSQDAINTQALPAYYDMSKWSRALSYGYVQRDGSQTGGIVRFSIDAIESACQKQNGQAAKKNCWSH